ncbi:MAG: hypothetical protein NT105_00455 [Verrucomicrobia bacterium]|nr:hypothetical protein [Verrucomicrobiota bacterium]
MNTTLRSRINGSPAKALLGIYSLCIAALLGASNEASWAAEGGATAAQPKAAGDVGPVRNKNIRILCKRTTIAKDGPKPDYLNSFWQGWFLGTCEEQLKAEGRSDGNSFKLLTKHDEPKDVDFQFCYCFDDTKGTATLRMSGKDAGLIHEFKTTTNYPTEDVLNKMKVTEADKLFVVIYADLNRQAYAWIRNGWRKE